MTYAPVLTVVTTLLLSSCTARAQEADLERSEPQAKRTFSYSRNPSNVVLFVHAFGSMKGAEASISIHGDGRVLVTHRPGRNLEEVTREMRLDQGEVEQALREMIDLGIADWDTTRIEAEQARESGGRIVGVADGEIVHVALSLEEYKNGTWETRDLEKNIRVTSPDLHSLRFPTIEEFQGVARARQLLWKLQKDAGLGR